MAEEDLDLVVHVGDDIHEQRTTERLADFRLLHALYRTSPDLQAAHARFPFVLTWDDHEIENHWADGASQPDREESNEPGRFAELRAAASQAYDEHLPLRRPQRPVGPEMLLYRALAWGDLRDVRSSTRASSAPTSSTTRSPPGSATRGRAIPAAR